MWAPAADWAAGSCGASLAYFTTPLLRNYPETDKPRPGHPPVASITKGHLTATAKIVRRAAAEIVRKSGEVPHPGAVRGAAGFVDFPPCAASSRGTARPSPRPPAVSPRSRSAGW
ncbi:hypothetical protein GCM10010319_39950 [Streptomyces blastmyceticus]|uniref:Uncharacterized protein n=1 Tax=Streptomyces blastmyceticus TaxID=68180 RepID=A0ABP3GZH1_9ACTN